MVNRFDPREGARNLLLNCIGVRPGQNVVIAAEDPGEGFYDAFAAECIRQVAVELGCRASLIPCPRVSGPEQLPASLVEPPGQVDHIVFQARAGDQIRFTRLAGSASRTMSYALDIGLLGSRFCTMHHGFMKEVLESFETRLSEAQSWRITCPLGTDVSAARIPRDSEEEDFTLRLFPIPIFRPVSCTGMSGRIAVANWLMSSANHAYADSFLGLHAPIVAVVEAGRIVEFEGPRNLVGRVQDHYRRVADLYGIEAEVVHSWHAGIHPKAFYPLDAVSNIERWGSVAFANPRYLHFHTCGNYAPGEIALSLFDATVELDGTVFWERGTFRFLEETRLVGRLRHYDLDGSALEQRFDIGI